MSKFILVHNACSSEPILINGENVVVVIKSENLTGCSHIFLNNIDADLSPFDFHVTETPEKIYEMLNN